MEGSLEPGSRRIEASPGRRPVPFSRSDGDPIEEDDLTASALGEVIEASTTRFVAQCPRAHLHDPPAFGAFVKVMPPDAPMAAPGEVGDIGSADPFADPRPRAPQELPVGTPDGVIYALVFAATTGSPEPGRRPTAYGLEEARLRQEQPQIFDLLTTEFAALHLAFAQEGRVRLDTPPRPPRLHAFVYACTPEEVCALTDSPDFVRPLLAAPGEVSPDELIAASLRHAYRCRHADFAFLVRAGKQLAQLLHADPERLTALLRKLEP
ncbi:MAG TPA: hypothetical protein VFB38_13360 [Chthonomonadaceae bacterium]|nr:hypothetical protein [Chthonomonadaceae bacterium]